MATYLTPEHWAKIRENNKNLRDTIDKIEIVGITAEEYEKKFPKLARLINLEEVKKMKLTKQKISVPASVGKVKVKAATKVLVPEGHLTPKDLAKILKTSAKELRKVIRKLKLKRTGKCWHWHHTDKELDQIKTAYFKSIAPKPEAKPLPAKLTAKISKLAKAEAEAEDAQDKTVIPPAM